MYVPLCTYVIHTCVWFKIMYVCCFIDPPAITAIEITEVCTNDFTVSWTAVINEEELSYSVTLFPGGITLNSIIGTSYNFTDLMPNTAYGVTVASILNRTCLGINNTKMITTLTEEAGVPQSELLFFVNM